MGLLIQVAAVATAANVALLGTLAVLWGRNYRKFRSKHTLGLTVFALILLAENGLGLYFYLLDPVMHDWYREGVPYLAMRATMILDVLETVAIAFLAWVTWD